MNENLYIKIFLRFFNNISIGFSKEIEEKMKKRFLVSQEDYNNNNNEKLAKTYEQLDESKNHIYLKFLSYQNGGRDILVDICREIAASQNGNEDEINTNINKDLINKIVSGLLVNALI